VTARARVAARRPSLDFSMLDSLFCVCFMRCL
jgi:hypothetical protein